MRSNIRGYVLRPATENDREYILKGLRDGIIASVPPNEASASELWIDDILSIASSHLSDTEMNEAFILQDADTKCGMIWMGLSRDQYTCDATGYLLGIYVNEDIRGKGIGRELLKAAEEWCCDKGLLSITLNVGAWNRNANGLYDSAGFAERSTVMRKDLT